MMVHAVMTAKIVANNNIYFCEKYIIIKLVLYKMILLLFLLCGVCVYAQTPCDYDPTPQPLVSSFSVSNCAEGPYYVITFSPNLVGFNYMLDNDTQFENPTFIGVASGQHNITIYQASNTSCVNSSLFVLPEIIIPPLPNSTIITNATCDNNFGSISFTFPDTNTTIFTGLTSGTSNDYPGTNSYVLPPGNYNLFIRQAPFTLSCMQIVPFTISSPTNASVMFNVSQPTCPSGNGTINVTDTLGNTYEFQSVNYTQSNSFFLPSGNYIFTVYGDELCTTNYTIDLNFINCTCPFDEIGVIVTSSSGNCKSPYDIILYTIPGTLEQLVYQFGSFEEQFTAFFPGISPGTYNYSIYVESNPTCIIYNTTTLPVVDGPPLPNISVTSQSCSESGSVGIFINYTGPNNIILEILGQPGFPTPYPGGTVVYFLNPGIYSLSVYFDRVSDTCFQEVQFEIPPYVLPYVNYIINQPKCPFLNGSISIIGIGTSYTEYRLLPIDPIFYTVPNTYNNLSSGSYTLETRDITNSSCGNNITILLDEPDCESCSGFIDPISYNLFPGFCSINNTWNVTITPQQFVVYSFNNSEYGPNNVFTDIPPGEYNISIQSIYNTTCYSNDTIFLGEIPYPSTPTIVITNQTCNSNGSISFTFPSLIMQVSLDNINYDTYPSTNSYSNLSPGNYILYNKGQGERPRDNTCIFQTPFTIGEYTFPSANFTVIQPSCGGNGTINVTSVVAGFSYGINGIDIVPRTLPHEYSLFPGTYILIVVNASDLNCLTTYQIILNTSFTPSINYTVIQPICNGNGTINVTEVSPQTQYELVDIDSNPRIIPHAYSLFPGNYELIAFSEISENVSCSIQIFISLDPGQGPNITYLVTQPSCGGNGTINVTEVPSGIAYYINNGDPMTEPFIYNLSPGNYNLFVYNITDPTCNATYLIILDPGAFPNITYSVVQPTCTSDGSITITSKSQPDIQFRLDFNPFTTIIPTIYTYLLPGNYTLESQFINTPSCNIINNIILLTPSGCNECNCTIDGICILDSSGYTCKCRPVCHLKCDPNCYIDNLTGQYVTIEGPNCDRRYIKLYDGPCCYDCKDCRISG